jgi:dihydrofolate reductase
MSKVLGGITTSLDGYIAAPGDGPGAGLGIGGERLHYWVFGGPWTYDGPRGEAAPEDKAYLGEVFGTGGAMIAGRAMYEAARGWGEDPGFGMPMFVVTHRPEETIVKGDTTFEFVGGIEEALARAREAAGEKNVIVMGGADVLRQFLSAGLLDELMLTIAPVLLGGGKRLFDGSEGSDIGFERTAVIESPWATHLRYTVKS